MTVLLSIIAVTLLAISVWQITKIFEISNLGAKKDDSQIASEKNKFDFNDVVSSITSKMVFRHPHVFKLSLIHI